MNNNIISESWTTEELQIWASAGLIPTELFAPGRHIELISYVIQNKEKLFNFYRKSNEEFDCLVKLPPPNEFHNTYELQVIDKKTGKVIKTLEQVKTFELCEGISLRVKAQELEQWEQETKGVRELTKEQGETFRTALSSLTKGALSRQDIVTLIEEVRKKRKTGKVRHSGHFTDSRLQSESQQKQALSESLSTKIKEITDNSSTTIKAFGIKLTPAEDKLVNAIYKLLHDKSENKNTKSEQFYTGNETNISVTYGKDQARSAVIRIKPAELYKEYLGKDEYSGKDIVNIKSTLTSLSEKKYVIQYDRHRKVKKGNKEEFLTDRIEDIQSLIKIMSYIEGMTAKEVEILDSGDTSFREQKEELIIALNPLLTDQINSKYIEYPSDINQRTMIASGGALKVTESIIDLRDYMMREISVHRYKCELDESTLINQIRLSSYAKSGRRKLVAQRINESIEANKKLGLILKSKKEIGAKGQVKYVFILNPDFE